MYEARQNKEKVSRRIDGNSMMRQRAKMKDGFNRVIGMSFQFSRRNQRQNQRRNQGQNQTNNQATWTVNDTNAQRRIDANVTESGLRTYYEWVNAVNSGSDPRSAIRLTERLQGSQMWSIRLSQRDRVYFTLNEGEHTVNVIQIGGHN